MEKSRILYVVMTSTCDNLYLTKLKSCNRQRLQPLEFYLNVKINKLGIDVL